MKFVFLSLHPSTTECFKFFVLGANCPAINVKLMYDIGMKLLDVYYLRRGKILVKLCRSATTVVRNHDISILGADHLYLATAIIAAGSHILNSSSSSIVCSYVRLYFRSF